MSFHDELPALVLDGISWHDASDRVRALPVINELGVRLADTHYSLYFIIFYSQYILSIHFGPRLPMQNLLPHILPHGALELAF